MKKKIHNQFLMQKNFLQLSKKKYPISEYAIDADLS
jgi:hypothetical protein